MNDVVVHLEMEDGSDPRDCDLFAKLFREGRAMFQFMNLPRFVLTYPGEVKEMIVETEGQRDLPVGKQPPGNVHVKYTLGSRVTEEEKIRDWGNAVPFYENMKNDAAAVWNMRSGSWEAMHPIDPSATSPPFIPCETSSTPTESAAVSTESADATSGDSAYEYVKYTLGSRLTEEEIRAAAIAAYPFPIAPASTAGSSDQSSGGSEPPTDEESKSASLSAEEQMKAVPMCDSEGNVIPLVDENGEPTS